MPKRPSRKLFLSFLTFAFASLVLFAGCRRTASVSTRAMTTTSSDDDKVGIASAMDALHKGTDVKSCRNALNQLNSFFVRRPERKPPTLSDSQRELLTTQFHLDPDELAEAGSPNYTLLDAHHLEFSLLLRDAARALDVDDLDPAARAAAGFGWVVRQVALQDGAPTVFPPEFVLRRGWGTSMERALLFIALLPHLGIDGCMMVIPGADKSQQGGRYWIPGALIDKDIYLFDTRMGMPLPGPKGDSIATLRQVRQQPDLLQALTFDDKHRYDVAPDEARRAEVRVGVFLSALAPRMAHLEELLASNNNKVNLSVDSTAVLEHFREATKGLGVEVKAWNMPGETVSPITVQRRFLPPEEGGIDKFQRKRRAEVEVVPRNALTPILARRFREDSDLGQRIRMQFQRLFVSFIFEPKKEPDEAKRQRAVKERQGEDPRGGSAEPSPDPIVLLTAGSRDLMLHGRFDEATVPLVELRDELRKAKAAVEGNPELQALMGNWVEEFATAYANLLRSERAQVSGDRESAQLQQARTRASALLAKSGEPLTKIMLASAAEPLAGLSTYFLALCKHEQAERLQSQVDHATSRTTRDAGHAAQEAWKGAADWWETYLTENPPTIWSNTARLLRARALVGLGNRPGAIALLEDASGASGPLDRVGRLYRAKQLEKQKP
jgi:hypothetical protein